MKDTAKACLQDQLHLYSAHDWSACYTCNDCTASCAITENGENFIKNIIKKVHSNSETSIINDLSPWFCYYCGDCSEKCSKDIIPGEIIMSLRRYLTSKYDWTGLSSLMYKSLKAHLSLIFLIFTLIIGSFWIFADFNIPLKDGIVQINSFAPVKIILFADEILLVVLSIFLLSNIFNLYKKIILNDKSIKIPFKLYLTEGKNALINFLTQKKFAKCERKLMYWISHLLIMSSYLIMFTIIGIFLYWFQTEEVYPISHPQRWLGYYAAFGFIFSTVYYIIGRIRKKEPVFKFSHHSDWIFIILLFIIALTGTLLHIFRISGMAKASYIMYTLHLAFEVPMVITLVAFSKWSHLAYRPLAIYFSDLKMAAKKRNP